MSKHSSRSSNGYGCNFRAGCRRDATLPAPFPPAGLPQAEQLLHARLDDLPAMADQAAGDHVVLRLILSLPSLSTMHRHQFHQVVGVHLRGVAAARWRRCWLPDDRDAVLDDGLAGFGEFAIAAAFGGQVHDHAARLHLSTAPAVISFGAGLPGTAAVVMTTSLSAITLAISSACLRC